jgi:hypothetical protein
MSGESLLPHQEGAKLGGRYQQQRGRTLCCFWVLVYLYSGREEIASLDDEEVARLQMECTRKGLLGRAGIAAYRG